MFGNDLVRFGPVRFGKKNSGSVRFGGSVKILVRSNTTKSSATFLEVILAEFALEQEKSKFLFLLATLECLIIVYTRNIFFGKFSLLHAVIKHLHDFRRRASRGENYFLPREIWKIWENNFEFHQHFVNYAHFSCKYIVTCQICSFLMLILIFDFLAKTGNSLIHDY